MKTNVKTYMPLIKKYLLQNQEVDHVTGSTYKCAISCRLEIHASAPEGQKGMYFFQCSLKKHTDQCLFILGNHLEAFCVDPNWLRGLPLSKASKGNHYLFSIQGDDGYGRSVMIVNKNGMNEHRIPITLVPLYEPITY